MVLLLPIVTRNLYRWAKQLPESRGQIPAYKSTYRLQILLLEFRSASISWPYSLLQIGVYLATDFTVYTIGANTQRMRKEIFLLKNSIGANIPRADLE